MALAHAGTLRRELRLRTCWTAADGTDYEVRTTAYTQFALTQSGLTSLVLFRLRQQHILRLSVNSV